MRLKTLIERIRYSPAVVMVRQWTQQSTMPGFGGIPIYDVFIFLRTELKKESLIVRANAMAFSFLLSLFPAIIFLFTLLPYLSIENLIETLKRSILEIMPAQGANYLFQTIDELTSIPREGLLSIGLVLALFFASNGIQTMLRGFYKSYEVSFRHRSGLQTRWTSIRITIFLGILLISSMVLLVIGRGTIVVILNAAGIAWLDPYAITSLRWVVLIALYYTGFSIIYRYGPALKQKLHFFSPGATMATVLTILSSVIFSFYVSKFNTYNKIYGSLGALIITMLWMQINSIIILIGYELNASIAINRDLRKMSEEEGM